VAKSRARTRKQFFPYQIQESSRLDKRRGRIKKKSEEVAEGQRSVYSKPITASDSPRESKPSKKTGPHRKRGKTGEVSASRTTAIFKITPHLDESEVSWSTGCIEGEKVKKKNPRRENSKIVDILSHQPYSSRDCT